jgi:predicted acyltransferase
MGYWLLFALWPLPTANFDWAANGISPEFQQAHWLSGFAAHWNKNVHPAHALDQWWLNLFPRPKPWQFNGGGYVTLSFIPTLGTMILGLLAGGWLQRRDRSEVQKLRALVIAGGVGLGVGAVLDLTGLCPNVKRIWTPAWVLFSGGWCCLLLAGFHAVFELGGRRAWAFPLIVVGSNSIFMYFIAHLWEEFIVRNLRTHLGADFWTHWAGATGPFWEGLTVLTCLWLACYALWRRRVFLRL